MNFIKRTNSRLVALIMISFLYSKINAQKIEDTLVDIDGNKYKTIVVGNQVWMVENLKTTRFNDGIKISNITDPITWVRTTEPAYSWYNNDILNKSTYGGLYNWHSVNTGKLCPEGWRVSTDSDWIFLLEFLENSTSKYKKLKNIGFYSILGGYRYGYYWGTGIFYEKDINGYWWTSTTATDTHNWSRTISSKNLKIYRSYFSSNNGFSVKCIKENFKKYSEYENQQYVTDIDGNIYYTIEIGPQKWMTENLKTTRYNDGTPIKNLTDITEWRNGNKPAYVWYDNDISHKEAFGALYNGYVVTSDKQLCPDGWRVASDADWKELEIFIGMTQEQADGTVWRGENEGGKLKEAGTERWASPNKGGTNENGLSIRPSGRRDSSGRFYDMSTGATIWTSTETSMSCAYYRHFSNSNAGIGRNPDGDKKFGLAVRCIKNE